MNTNIEKSNFEIAIVGGAGFLGSRISKRLSKRNEFFKIYDIKKNQDNQCIYIDVEDQGSLDQLSNSDIIINLAAIHSDDAPTSKYYDVNVQGAENVCDAARKYNIKKIIFTSSVAIYGFAEPNTDESGAPNYFNDYGRSKYLAEQVYRKWFDEDPENRTLVIVRPTVIFGEGNRGNVYNLLNTVAKKRFVMFGDGKNKKSMAYVENVAAFIEYCLSFKKGLHIYNYIDKPDFDMNTLISNTREELFNKKNIGFRFPAMIGLFIGIFFDLVSKIIRKNLPISRIRIKKFMGTTQFSSSIFKTDFVPSVTLEEGLRKTIKYEFLEDNSDKPTFDTE